MVYVAEVWRIAMYLAPPFAGVFVLAAGLSVVVNTVARERVLNPWLWGALAMVCLAVCATVYHFVMLYGTRAAP